MTNLQEVKFAKKIGIELTFIPKVVVPELDESPHNYGWHKLTKFYKAAAVAEKLRGANKIYCDPGCIEYPSPILKDWKTTQEWFEGATDLGKMMELVTTHPKQENGMGHIHISCNAYERSMMIFESVFRPYLSWLFASPISQEFCRSTLGSFLRSGTDYCVVPRKGCDHEYHGNSGVWSRFVAFAPRSDLDTMEIRMFDSAKDWRQQEEHVAFAQRLYALAMKRKPGETILDGFPVVHSNDRLKLLQFRMDCYRNSIDLCIREYKELIETLGLPWNRYKRYIDKNLVPAFEHGELL